VKSGLRLFAALMITCACLLGLVRPGSAAIPGDVTLDGIVDGADVAVLHRHLAGEVALSPEAQLAADVAPHVGGQSTPDGFRTAGDLVVLQRAVVGELALASGPPPPLAVGISSPTEGEPVASATLAVTGTVNRGGATVTVNGVNAVLNGGTWTATAVPLAPGAPGSNRILAEAQVDSEVVRDEVVVVFDDSPPAELPPDPSQPALHPPSDPSGSTALGLAASFLYEAAEPVQTGVQPGAIAPLRAGVVRGRVLTPAGAPLPGVRAFIPGAPDLGETLSREDGVFDLAVNGGGPVTVELGRRGYTRAQRQVELSWQEMRRIDDVILRPLDAEATEVDLAGGPLQRFHQGSTVEDNAGQRRAAVFFPAGTKATLEIPGQPSQPLSGALTLRTTEVTVGEEGRRSMPAALPAASGYTYAVEVSVDEALEEGAESVVFNQPVPVYVDNFLGMPVGSGVPVGIYNFREQAWEAHDDGRVIEIEGVDGNGRAEIDADLNDGPDSDGDLAALGFTDQERLQLALAYPVGKTLWRAPVPHFSTIDLNWPFKLPAGAGPWNQPDFGCWEGDCPKCDCPGEVCPENSCVATSTPVVGTADSLHHTSERSPGFSPAYTATIPLTGADLNPGLSGVQVEYSIAGQRVRRSFPASSSLTDSFTWDGKDAYGRTVQGKQRLRVRIVNEWDVSYLAFVPSVLRRFGLAVPGDEQVGEIFSERAGFLWGREVDREIYLGTYDARAAGMGGLTLSSHHYYDPVSGTVDEGNGRRRDLDTLEGVIDTIAGTGVAGSSGDGGPATEAQIRGANSIAIGPDGAVYFNEPNLSVVRRIDVDGIVTRFAGSGVLGSGGVPGQLAVDADFGQSQSVAVGPDGDVYVLDPGNQDLWRIGDDGVLQEVVAPVSLWSSPKLVAVRPDGGILVRTTNPAAGSLLEVRPDGSEVLVAGAGAPAGFVDGVPATESRMGGQNPVALAEDGSIYVAEPDLHTIRRIDPSGIVDTFAGAGGSAGSQEEFVPALEARMFQLLSLAVGPDGSIFYGEGTPDGGRVRRITPDGLIHTVVGPGEPGPSVGDGGPASAAVLRPNQLHFHPDGRMVVGDAVNARIRAVSRAMPGFDLGELAVPSEDGSRIFRFSPAGRHLETLHGLTGAVLQTFEYDAEGRLETVRDFDGNETRMVRAGNVVTIQTPFGPETEVELDASGFARSVTNPEGERVEYDYVASTTGGGLLSRIEDPRFHDTVFDWNLLTGRLASRTDARGGVVSLERVDDALQGRSFAELTRNQGRKRTVDTQQLLDRSQRKVREDSAGIPAERLERSNGDTERLGRTGVFRLETPAPDPRFGMLSPVPSRLQVQLPSMQGETPTAFVRTQARSTTFDPAGELETQTDTVEVNGTPLATRSYDRASNTFLTLSAESRSAARVIDAAGRVTESGLGDLAPAEFAYDAQGRLQFIHQGSGARRRTTELRYDASGFLERVIDPALRETSFLYDGAGRVTQQTLPDGRTIVFGYDASGNLTSLSPPGRPAHLFRYDELDQETEYDPPPVVGVPDPVTEFVYDLDRDLEAIHRPGGHSVDPEYDAAGRLETLTTTGGAAGPLSYSLGYDPTTGQLDTVTAPGPGSPEAVDLDYDGPVVTGATWSGPVAGSVERTVDERLLVASERVNGAWEVLFSYDDDRLLAGAGALAVTSREPTTGLLGTTSVGGVTTTRGYNEFGELTSQTTTAGGTPVYDVTYTRDLLGRIETKTESLEGAAPVVTAYTYEPSGRLDTVSVDGVLVRDHAYDANGNRLSTLPGQPPQATYDDQDRLVQRGSVTYSYTPAGELLSRTDGTGDTLTTAYDAFGNLRSATLPDGRQVSYVVDGLQRRVGKRVDGAPVQGFLYADALNPVAELDGAGQVVARFVDSCRPSAGVEAGAGFLPGDRAGRSPKRVSRESCAHHFPERRGVDFAG